MRTLVISDLHLGSRLGRDVLRRPAALDVLLRALDGIDRLVLLGDVVELAEGRPHEAMAAAEPILRAIGARLGPDREVILVPGNHDRPLVRPWFRRHGGPIAVDGALPADGSPRLSRVTGWLAPARVRVHYPGVWLSSRVFATHGHYLDRHLLPTSAWGITRGLLRRAPRLQVVPRDYEPPRVSALRPADGLLAGRLPRPLAILLDDAAELLRAATMPRLRRGLKTRRFGRFARAYLGTQMQRASIPALARVVHRLGVDADWVVFGHVHRLGPLPGDDHALWAGPGGRPRVANTGCWVYEALLLHHAEPPHPYWPGGALLIEDEGDPQPVGLLDGLALDLVAGRLSPAPSAA